MVFGVGVGVQYRRHRSVRGKSESREWGAWVGRGSPRSEDERRLGADLSAGLNRFGAGLIEEDEGEGGLYDSERIPPHYDYEEGQDE